VSQDSLKVTLTADQNDRNLKDGAEPTTFFIAWKKARSRKPRDIIIPAGPGLAQDRRPIRVETRTKLVSSIARGRRWLDELVAGAVTTIDQVAARERCSIRQVNMTISLAFLAPTLVSAAIEGRLPRGIGVASLRDAPLEWSRQLTMLGLPS
jgi:site-specific DNA recombinase